MPAADMVRVTGRVVTIKADSLHTTAGGRGYRFADEERGRVHAL